MKVCWCRNKLGVDEQQRRRPVSEVIMVLITVGAASLIRSQPAADGVNRCTGNSLRRQNKKRQRGQIKNQNMMSFTESANLSD